MHLTLLRHATAESWNLGADDFGRELVENGMHEARAAGRFAKLQGWEPDLVLSSPLVRARQTAELFSVQAGGAEATEAAFLASGMTPESGAAELRDYLQFNHVVIVGHEPDFSGLIAFLTGFPQGNIEVKKASLWGLQCNRLAAGSAQLKYSILPKQLRPLTPEA
ncbi:MAG: histidine phosphatase family protein [Verrucomicrobiota bacterium]